MEAAPPGRDMALQTEAISQEDEMYHGRRHRQSREDDEGQSADDFDDGWTRSAGSGLASLGEAKSGRTIEHTFLGGDESLNMLVSEQQ